MPVCAISLEIGATFTPKTEAERQKRMAWGVEGIAEARTELDSGLYVDSVEIGSWINRIVTDNELPPPNPAPLIGLASPYIMVLADWGPSRPRTAGIRDRR